MDVRMDSQVVFIYGLYDPRDGSLRYIGCSYDLTKRLKEHIKKPLRCVAEWFADLKLNGLKPTIAAIEEVEGYSLARRRENELIHEHARLIGNHLLNAYGRIDYWAEREKRNRARQSRRDEIVERRRMRESLRRINCPRQRQFQRIIEHDGLRLNISQWARRLGISRQAVHQRLSKHPVEIALRGITG
jgi:predicted GIY-YIG superfamily endonuclease